MGKKRKLLDEYYIPGYRPKAEIKGIFGDHKARVIKLERRQKKRYAVAVGKFIGTITTRRQDRYGTYPVGMPGYICKWRFDVFHVGNVGK